MVDLLLMSFSVSSEQSVNEVNKCHMGWRVVA